jgi:hypothetical protein
MKEDEADTQRISSFVEKKLNGVNKKSTGSINERDFRKAVWK